MKIQLDVVDNGDGTKSVTVTKTPLTLSISNTIEYEPITDYNPATKKYVDTELTKKVNTEQGLSLWTGTKAEYDAITSKSNTTLYFIKEG